jgi:putative hydrolase of HD superfamily
MKDLDSYLYWKHPGREHHKYNGPYYLRETEEELKILGEELASRIRSGSGQVMRNKKVVVDLNADELVGEVNWYWKSQETFWMEVGLVIFNEKYWGQGLGTVILISWITEIFKDFPELVRIGLSTWSGNERMMRLSEKIGLKKEAVYRKARIVQGKYYDSVSYGILREEWEDLRRCAQKEDLPKL